MLTGVTIHARSSLPIVRAAFATQRDVISVACIARAIHALKLPAPATIGVYYAGTMPYLLPEHRFHDFLGKSDRHIARGRAHPGPPGHNKWDYAYSLGRVRPDLIVTAVPLAVFDDSRGAQYREDVKRDYGFTVALWLDPIFRSEYRPHRLVPPPGSSTTWPKHWVYARAGFTVPRPLQMPAGLCLTGLP